MVAAGLRLRSRRRCRCFARFMLQIGSNQTVFGCVCNHSDRLRRPRLVIVGRRDAIDPGEVADIVDLEGRAPEVSGQLSIEVSQECLCLSSFVAVRHYQRLVEGKEDMKTVAAMLDQKRRDLERPDQP